MTRAGSKGRRVVGRSRSHIFAAAALVALFAQAMPSPAAADEPPKIRYRDEVFTSVKATKDIVYGHAVNYRGEDEQLKLDLYEPEGDTEPFRAVYLWAHGGGLTGGDKADFEPIPGFLGRRGWVVISVNYRLQRSDPLTGLVGVNEGLQGFEDAGHDLSAAVRWVRANAARLRLDAGRVAVGGQSAGADVALIAAYNWENPGDSGNPGYPSRPIAALATGAINVTIIPKNYITPLVEPPVAYFHGTHDTSAPIAAPLTLCAAAVALLNYCEFHPYPNAGHGFTVGMADWTGFLYPYVIDGKITKTDTTMAVHAPPTGQTTDPVDVSATLTGVDGPLANRRVTFELGDTQVEATTDALGVARTTLDVAGSPRSTQIAARFDGEEDLEPSQGSAPFTVLIEGTNLRYDGDTSAKGPSVAVAAVLTDDDGTPLGGRTVRFEANGSSVEGVTGPGGRAAARLAVPGHGRQQQVKASYGGENHFAPASTTATVTWGGGHG